MDGKNVNRKYGKERVRESKALIVTVLFFFCSFFFI